MLMTMVFFSLIYLLATVNTSTRPERFTRKLVKIGYAA
jgi:hypothetical protein